MSATAIVAARLRFFKLTLKFSKLIKEHRYIEVDAENLERLADFTKLDDLKEFAIESGQLEEGDADFVKGFTEIEQDEYIEAV